MIFFPYDLDEYKKNPGIWEEYEEIVPGPIAHDTSEIIHYIKQNKFDFNKYELFSSIWNEYSNGNSSKTIAQYIVQRQFSNRKNY